MERWRGTKHWNFQFGRLEKAFSIGEIEMSKRRLWFSKNERMQKDFSAVFLVGEAENHNEANHNGSKCRNLRPWPFALLVISIWKSHNETHWSPQVSNVVNLRMSIVTGSARKFDANRVTRSELQAAILTNGDVWNHFNKISLTRESQAFESFRTSSGWNSKLFQRSAKPFEPAAPSKSQRFELNCSIRNDLKFKFWTNCGQFPAERYLGSFLVRISDWFSF